MNIFFTSPDPTECAEYLDDKRVNKMILETAQMLSTALRLSGYSGDDVYKPTHANHPSNVWIRSSKANYEWAINHLKALGLEKQRRTGKGHKSLDLLEVFIKNKHLIKEGPLTPFANCAANKELNLDFKCLTDVHKAYKLYLKQRWLNDKKIPLWNGIQRRL